MEAAIVLIRFKTVFGEICKSLAMLLTPHPSFTCATISLLRNDL
jgi:hypothetical protein